MKRTLKTIAGVYVIFAGVMGLVLGAIGNKTYKNVMEAAKKLDIDFTLSTVWSGQFQKDVGKYIQGIWKYRENIGSFFVLYKFECFLLAVAFILCIAVLFYAKKRNTFWIVITFCITFTMIYEIIGWNKLAELQNVMESVSGLMKQFEDNSVSALVSMFKPNVLLELGSGVTTFTSFKDFYVVKITMELVAAFVSALNLVFEKDI